MLVHRYFVFLAFVVLGVILIIQVIKLRRKGEQFLGKPAIDKFNFFTGKMTIFTSWGLFIFKAISPDTGYITVPAILSWIAVGLLWAGTIIMSIAFIDLGQSLKVGIPIVPTRLKTDGIYRFNRNPLYLGVFLISFGSCFYFPDLINITFVFYGIFIHHRIVLGEEQFLSARFGLEWEEYRKRTRRYI
ncbi:MAG: isoprenylcysteine carboxylmethyltransferase family protein [Bacteroidales bacterium]|nr:isoprenylcysteine carboxylmethyltransferase family protein [Bacteroidales bacterium]